MDIDGLKTVNDTLGHNAGDQLLTDFSDLLRRCIRKDDIPIRFGGDEFILLLPHTDEPHFREIWKRIEGAAEEFNRFAGRAYYLSFSHGYHIVERVDGETDFSAIILMADKRMYRQKKQNKKKGVKIIPSDQ